MQANLTLGEYIRRRRRELKMSLMDLANATGVSYTHLSRIESDSSLPNADTVAKIARVLSGDLRVMLEMAKCLPREILDRIAGHDVAVGGSLNRAAFRDQANDSAEATGNRSVVDFARESGLDELEAAEIEDAVKILCSINGQTRQQLVGFIRTLRSEGDVSEG